MAGIIRLGSCADGAPGARKEDIYGAIFSAYGDLSSGQTTGESTLFDVPLAPVFQLAQVALTQHIDSELFKHPLQGT